MRLANGAVLAIRFLLEIGTVLGIAYGGIRNENRLVKLLFGLVIPIVIIIVWSIYGAPKSEHALKGLQKFILEVSVYGVGIFSFFYLFSNQLSIIYSGIVVVGLILFYALGLQGN